MKKQEDNGRAEFYYRNAAQLINQDSGDTDYYTPAPIVDAARLTMGGIDLDPASSEIANRTVKATNYFSRDGLSQIWWGRVWMNHPFARGANADWIDTLVGSYELGAVSQACCITFASTSERWFQPLLNYPQCYLSPRTNYYLADGSVKRGVTKGSVVTYLGSNIGPFIDNFHFKLGAVVLPVRLLGWLP